MTVPAVVYVILHLAGALTPSRLWGVDLLAYYPAPVGLLFIAAPLLAWAVLRRKARAWRLPSWTGRQVDRGWIFCGLVPVFFLLRDRTHYLGDSAKWFALLEIARRGQRSPADIGWHNARLDVQGFEFINVQQMLDLLLHYGAYRVGHAVAGWSAATTYEWVSSVAGGIYVCVLWHLARRAVGGSSAHACFAFLLSLGTLQLFCGYGESYTLVTLLCAVYLWLAIDSLATARAPWLPGIVLIGAVATHVLAAALLPSWGYLAWQYGPLRQRLARPRLWVPLAVALAMIAAGIYQGLYHGLHLPLRVSGDDGRYGLLSLRHAATLANELLLVSPFALVWGAVALARRQPGGVVRAFTGWAAAGTGSLIVVHNIIMGGRDWDLMSFPALSLSLWGFLCLRDLLAGQEGQALWRWTIPVMAVHTFLWIGTNADHDRAVARLLNLLQGDANQTVHYRQFTLAHYYMTISDTPEKAIEALRQAIHAAPQDSTGLSGPRRRYLEYLASASVRLDRLRLAQEIYALTFPPGKMPLFTGRDPDFQVRWVSQFLRTGEESFLAGRPEQARSHWRRAMLYAVRISQSLPMPALGRLAQSVLTTPAGRAAFERQWRAFQQEQRRP